MWLAQFLTSIGACTQSKVSNPNCRGCQDHSTRADDRLTCDAESNYMAVHVPNGAPPGPSRPEINEVNRRNTSKPSRNRVDRGRASLVRMEYHPLRMA